MMNINEDPTQMNESKISVGVHVEAIDKHGNWCEAEVVNIIENNLILKFLDRVEAFHLIIDMSTNKWHHIDNPKANTFSFRTKMFEKGDLVLSKWQDDKYHLSQILDITTKNETKEKEYHILYLYDNVYDIVSQSQLKCPNSSHNTGCYFINQCSDNEIRVSKKSCKRRFETTNDIVFYDKNMNTFTENNKLRRLKVSNMNDGSNDSILSNYIGISLPMEKLSKDNELIQSSFRPHESLSLFNFDSIQRHSQRIKRNSYKNSDYFYTDCEDNILKDKNKTSTNNSQVSTPLPYELSDELSNHSPVSVPMTTLYSSYLKQKTEYFLNILNDKVNANDQTLNKSNENGIKHGKHVTGDLEISSVPSIYDQSAEQLDQTVPNSVDSSNKKHNSSFLKANRKYVERKKKYSKSKIKSSIGLKSRNIDNSINDKSKHFMNSSTDASCPSRLTNRKIIYCHRCKKSSYNKDLIQCNVCLCWSDRICSLSTDCQDNDSFWECDNCVNTDEVDGTKSSAWYRDKCRFYSIPKNELPWSPASAHTEFPCSIKRICEMQSLLSLSQRVIHAITQRMDMFFFKESNDCSSADDLDIFKNICAYDTISDINITHRKANNLTDIISTHPPRDRVSFFNSTPIKTGSDRHTMINTSLDGILDCEIQKLDFLPKADFDALIDDLNFSDDICKQANEDNHSRSSILDLIDDNREINNNNVVITDPGIPFTKSSFLYHNLVFDGSDSVNDSTNDDVSFLLLDKHSQKSQTICDNFDIQDNKRSKFSSDHRTSDHSDINESGSTSFINTLPVKSESKTELIDYGSSDIHPDNSNIEPDMSSVLIDSDRLLSSSDSECLQWLVSKYNSVEKIVESIEKTVLSSDTGDEMLDNIDKKYRKMTKYLDWLLYTVGRD